MWPLRSRPGSPSGRAGSPSSQRHLSLLALAALLPIVGLSVMLGAAWLQQRQAAMEQDAANRVAHLTQRLEGDLAAQVASLQMLAAALPVDAGGFDRAAFFAMAERARTHQPLWKTLVLSDPEGNRLADAPEQVAGAPGKVVDLESHARAVATGAPVVGTVLRGPRNRAAFAVRVPVVRDGRLRYLLSAVVDPRHLKEILLANGLPSDWIGVVVDGSGHIVARTRGDEALVGTMASARVLQVRREEPEGFYDSVGLDGFPLRSVYRKLPDVGWSIHFGLPREIFAAPLRQAALLMAGGGLLCVALAGLFAWLFVRELRIRRRQDIAYEAARRLEAMGQMTRGVAHDFNNLLQAMAACLTLVERKASAAGLAPVLQAGHQAVDRGAKLTRQLLAFARRQPLEPKPIAIRDQLLAMSELMARTLRPDIRLEVDIAPDLWTVEVDQTQFEVTILNILANARDAMPEPGVLTIRARNTNRSAGVDPGELTGAYVALSVEDTGAGMSPDTVARAFEPFFTTKQANGGTGLGLSQAYGFARQSHGTILIDSRQGLGTTVTILLPRSDKVPAAGRGDLRRSLNAVGGRILLVEDDPVVGSMLSAILGDLGYSLRRATSGDEALRMLEAGDEADLVLSDIVMPGELSGVGLLRIVRQRWPLLPVVLMTGYSEELVPKEVARLLPKPFAVADLVAALEEELTRSGRHRTPRSVPG